MKTGLPRKNGSPQSNAVNVLLVAGPARSGSTVSVASIVSALATENATSATVPFAPCISALSDSADAGQKKSDWSLQIVIEVSGKKYPFEPVSRKLLLSELPR